MTRPGRADVPARVAHPRAPLRGAGRVVVHEEIDAFLGAERSPDPRHAAVRRSAGRSRSVTGSMSSRCRRSRRDHARIQADSVEARLRSSTSPPGRGPRLGTGSTTTTTDDNHRRQPPTTTTPGHSRVLKPHIGKSRTAVCRLCAGFAPYGARRRASRGGRAGDGPPSAGLSAGSRRPARSGASPRALAGPRRVAPREAGAAHVLLRIAVAHRIPSRRQVVQARYENVLAHLLDRAMRGRELRLVNHVDPVEARRRPVVTRCGRAPRPRPRRAASARARACCRERSRSSTI